MSRPLRVLHAAASFAPAYRLGGPTRSLEGLVAGLRAAGAEVRVLTTDSHGAEKLDVPRGWTTWNGTPVRYVPRWLPPATTPAYLPLAIAAAREADVVHVTSLWNDVVAQALLAAAIARRPVVLSPRGTLEPSALAHGRAALKRAWLRAFAPLLARVSVFHATAEGEAESIRRVFGPTARVVIVPNGADVAALEAVRAARAAHVGAPIVAFVGRLHPIKALDRLIDAVAVLRDRGVAAELRLFGPEAERGHVRSLEAQVSARKLEGHVRFPGEVDGPAKLAAYAQASALALPSHSENFGNVVLEALACETPVVASRGTPWEVLELWRAGRWVTNDPAELAEALAPYLVDAELARASGARGRREVEARYGWSAIGREMSDVYRSVAAESFLSTSF